MRAYISAKYDSFADRTFLERFCREIESLGLETFLLPRDEEKWFEKRLKGEALIEKIKEEIRKSDVLILEFSQGEVNTGVEIGQAFFLGIPIIIVTSRTALSPTMQGIADQVVRYTSMDDLKAKLKSSMEKVKDMEKRKIKINF
jgi:predicted phosphoribosyltransferase